LNDLERLTRDLPAMDRLERTLKLCHLFPTVPDTLSGFPFALRDPLVLDKLPHVYFCGNQPQFERKMAKIDNSDGKGANSGNK
jgi:DNA polymerase delta subunit 2